MELLSMEYKIWLNNRPPSPEAKLAQAIVKDWYRTVLSLSRRTLRGKDLQQWQKEIRWPDTDNARFWVERVLKGNMAVLKEIRDSLVQAKRNNRRNPK